MSAYQLLQQRFKRIGTLAGAQSMLHWDMATMMPSGGSGARAEQLATLEVLQHELLTAPETGDLLEQAQQEPLDHWQAANLREMLRSHRSATAVPPELVEALTKACRRCEMLWREARKNDDFAAVRPALAEVIARVRESAAARGAALGLTPYDALLEQYQPGLRAARVESLFAPLRTALPELIEGALAAQAARPTPLVPQGPFPQAAQEALARNLMERLGFPFDQGRLDTSLHPFSGGTPDDLRITTRWDEADYSSAIMGVLHETGHALYEAGLPRDWRLQPVGEARGMAVHESQSLLVEMQACRSRAFLAYLAPLLAQHFGADPAWKPENLYRLATRVERGFIRVDADEVTYPAHVLLRYELEPALLSGDLPLADLPGAWREQARALVGAVPPGDGFGCLQDIHWYDGAFGYFPTYTLGAMTAAQLYRAAVESDAAIPDALEQGDFTPLLAWMRREIHARASLLEWEELVETATGRPLDPEIYLDHLRQRYLG
ncbi:carboxypeptidase M32 [Aquibaculum arenosum]|uniref:Metal-dependent carboxypeptidase n=1 Tax=Aquibaculum arenosum TaxID=3032591 RepID=A0ABT5YM46_9PROT|nr:carboxypeptidase M32 [Fodinicurvata sp. CAU 1616]MDF2095939.1 carboxypeptidase M32 [Fodinicurvata sp. CAU 1616]